MQKTSKSNTGGRFLLAKTHKSSPTPEEHLLAKIGTSQGGKVDFCCSLEQTLDSSCHSLSLFFFPPNFIPLFVAFLFNLI